MAFIESLKFRKNLYQGYYFHLKEKIQFSCLKNQNLINYDFKDLFGQGLKRVIFLL